MSEQPNVHLALSGRAENVVLVREILSGLADSVDFGRALDDVKAAVSEACNNVVLHAYGGEVGPMEVDVSVAQGRLEVVVRDFGVGTAVRADSDETPGRGIGLAVIEALSSGLELRSYPGEGVEVAMSFEIPGGSAERAAPPPRPLDDGTAISLAIAPASLCRGIVERLLSALAARAGFTLDRLSDTQLVSDALAARLAGPLGAGGVALAVEERDRSVILRLGGLPAGAVDGLLAAHDVAELGGVVERLADEVEIERDRGEEVLRLVMRAA